MSIFDRNERKPAQRRRELTPEELARAKELYWRYACNHFFLHRDGDAGEYYAYDIPPEQEAVWRAEYIAYWTERLSVDDLKPLRCLHDAEAHEAVPRMMELAEQGDSLARFWFAYALLWCGSGNREAQSLGWRLFHELAEGSIELTPEHREVAKAYGWGEKPEQRLKSRAAEIIRAGRI